MNFLMRLGGAALRGATRSVQELDGRGATFQPQAVSLADYRVAANAAAYFGSYLGTTQARGPKMD
tara:strand:+ start:100 stop:294 length:195 start_codon:yes stop_codon:yes gene_type:complete